MTDKPSAPLSVSVVAIDSTTVDMTWSSVSNGSCIDNYTVRVINEITTRNFTTNSTSLIVDGLEQGLNYSFSVRAVDLMGREGTTSETVTLTLDGM